MAELGEDQVWLLLDEIKDPEIPVVSLVEMGMIRGVAVQEGLVQVTLSPTFSGCPALHVMREEIEQHLLQAGVQQVEVFISHSPPWTSNWITTEGRQKLKDFGLAPPPAHSGLIEANMLEVASCPYCNSTNTSLKNSFGPTLCRAIFYCNDCRQPFEQFKPL